jgi:imidazolonepropionase-like amidohydrolase
VTTIRIPAHETVYIFASRIFTALGSVTEHNMLLVIKNGLIEAVRPASKEDLATLSLKKVNLHYCGPDLTVMPALIDAHIHLALCCRNGSLSADKLSPQDLDRQQMQALFDQLVQAGVTLVRDGGDRQVLNLQARQLAAANPEQGLQIVATGEALRRHGGYGSFLGRGYRSRADLETLLTEAIHSGVDQLKVVVSGVISFSEYGVVKGPLLPAADLALIVKTARSHNLKIMAHASSPEAVDLAVTAGVDSVEHGYFVRKETLQKMADQQIAWVPTIIPVASQLCESQASRYTNVEQAVIRKAYREQLEKLHFAFACGVPVGVGTDAGAVGVRPSESLVKEMKLYREGKVENSAIVKAATAVNAEILGLEKETGTIEVGKKPYLLTVYGDPLSDLAALRYIEKRFIPVKEH